MNFCQTYFSKDLDDVTADDLIHFFNSPQKESQYLEFKSAREPNLDKVFTNTLKPGICSFLNSEGGLLIFGAPKEDKKNPEHPYHGPIQPYRKGFLGEHDTIIRKISDGIIPMPVGVRLKEIEFENGVVSIFEIQPSQTKPHQTDNIYQIRIDGQKKPAPHYLIEAMMKQVQWPELNGFIRFVECEKTDENHIFHFRTVFVNKTATTNAKSIEGSISCSVKGKRKYENLSRVPFLSSGLTQSILCQIEIENKYFRSFDPTKIEFGFIFCGENTKPKISYYILEIEEVYGIEKILDHQIITSEENLSIDNFTTSHPNQKILPKH